MKKNIIYFVILFFAIQNSVLAQKNDAEKSDPKAKILLDKLKKQYDGYKTMQVEFTLTIEGAENSKPEIQRGKLTQEGEKYYAQMSNQLIISDGKSIWLYQKKNNEVQISNANPDEKDGNMLSPKALIKMYESGKLRYTLSGDDVEGSRKVKLIEFKPTDKKADYSKMRLALDSQTNEVVSLRAFNKDGSRYILKLDKLLTNKVLEANIFSFDKSKYPNVHVEDLRI